MLGILTFIFLKKNMLPPGFPVVYKSLSRSPSSQQCEVIAFSSLSGFTFHMQSFQEPKVS